MKTGFIYDLKRKRGQCRSEIRLHVLCGLILIYTVHKSFLRRHRLKKIKKLLAHAVYTLSNGKVYRIAWSMAKFVIFHRKENSSVRLDYFIIRVAKNVMTEKLL